MRTITLLSFLFCLFGSTLVTAQVKDKEKKSIRIPAEPSKIKIDSALTQIKVAPDFTNETNKTKEESLNSEKKFTFRYSERPFSMIQDDGLKNPGEIFEKRWKTEAEKGGIIRTMSDQFLGEHRVDTKLVNIVCRDHEYADGDRVQIMLNGFIVQSNLLLTNSYRRVEVNLAEGKNTLDIIALNQGESGPNTAEFVVYDDKGKVISSKEWNLLTGVKATIVFINEKVVIKETTTDTSEEATNN